MNQIAREKPKVIGNYLDSLGFGNQSWREKASHYLVGLFNGFKRFSLQALSEASDCFTYRQNYYFLTSARWSEEKLNTKRLDFLKADKRTRPRKDGVMSIDDTSTVKNGNKTEGVFHQYAPSEGRIANCKVVVTAHYSDLQGRNFPLDLATYHKDKESKLELAKELIEKTRQAIPWLKHVTFDSWYAKESVIRFIESRGLFWYSRLREDRNVVYQGQPIKVSGLVKAASALLADPGSRFIDLREVWIRGLGSYRIVIDPKTEEHVVTNNTELPPEKVAAYYGLRWKIDEFYREAKDNIAFGQFQIRKDSSIKRHWFLVFLAYTFWIHCRLKGVLTKIYNGTVKTLSELTKILQNLNLLRLSIQPKNVLLANFSLKVIN